MLVAYRAEVSIAKLWEEVWERASSEAAFQIRYLNAVDGIIRESARVTIILSTSLGESLP